MAMFWRALQEEVLGTVDEIRQKGAVGAFRDAALDAKDLTVGASSWLIERAKSLEGNLLYDPVLLYNGLPPQGGLAPVHFPDGRVQQAVVLLVDSSSEPPTAHVAFPGSQEGSQQTLVLRIMDPDALTNDSATESADSPGVTADAEPRASVLQGLKQDVIGTVNDLRQSNAAGTIREKAIETKGLAADASSWLLGGVRDFVSGNEPDGYILAKGIPSQGASVPLHFPDGRVLEAVVVDTDGVSDPPRARVTIPDAEAPLLVTIMDPELHEQKTMASASASSASTGDATTDGIDGDRRPSMIDGLKHEWNQTVQDFRDKGAVGAMKAAALDTVDIVGGHAATAVSGARSLASPLIDLDWSGTSLGPAASQESKPAASDPPTDGEIGEGGSSASTASFPGVGTGMALLGGIKFELQSTVQDIREKGAVGTVRDVALDAVDIVGSTATAAMSGARSIAVPLMEQVKKADLWTDPLPNDGANAERNSPPFEPPARVQPANPATSSASGAVHVESQESSGSAPFSPTQGPLGGSDTADASPPEKRKSLVSMRRGAFEKPKTDEPNRDEEEVID